MQHALLVLALAASLSAQTNIVSPAAYTNAEAPSGNAFPFGSAASQFRYLNVHDDLAGTPRTILAFALRKGATTSTTITPALSVVMDGFMSTAVTTGATVVASYDANHGADKAQVLTGRTISFPPFGTGIIPYPFVYAVPLDAPFSYAGAGPLCWEVRITSRPLSGSASHDYVGGSSTNPSMAASRYGDGCLAAGHTLPFTVTGGSSVTWTTNQGQVTATTSEGPANASAFYLFGASGTSYGGIPLPFPLPGTTGGSSGTCWLNSDILLTVPGTLSGTGAVTFRVAVPLFPWFGGLNVFGQAVALDVAANSLGLVTSNGINHHIVRPHGNPPGGRVYTSSLAASGTAAPNQTLVVQFTAQ